MSQINSTAKYNERRRNAGTGPRHRRPETPRQILASAVYLPGAIKAHKYHRAEPTAARLSEESLRTQSEKVISDQKHDRRRRRVIGSTAAAVLAATLAAGAAHVVKERPESDVNPAPSSQAGIAKQVGALASGVYLAYYNVSEGGNGKDTTPGRTIGVNVTLPNGGTEYAQVSSKNTILGYNGMSVPNPASIQNLTAIRSTANGDKIITTYALRNGQWQVNKSVAGNGRNTQTQVAMVDGEATLHKTTTPYEGTADVPRNITNPDLINAGTARINTEVSQNVAQLASITGHRYQPPIVV